MSEYHFTGTSSRAGSAWVVWPAVYLLLTACTALFHHEQVTYEEGGIRIGIESDLSTRRATPHAVNAHPARLTAQQVRHLLGLIEVSGYSGTIAGIFVTPPKRPVFNEEEIDAMAEPVAAALRAAGPEERVFFSIANPNARYERDHTEGALFLRGPYLHFILTDHYAFLRADTASNDAYKDPLDMKGMKLWVMSPAAAADVPPSQVPRWNLFETVHVSVNVSQALAALASQTIPHPAPAPPHEGGQPPASGAAPPTAPSQARSGSEADLRTQIRELTDSNRALQERLDEQTQAMETMKRELQQMRKALSNAVKKPGTKQNPSPTP